ncbi:MAG: Hsp20/alpha crystallin family protein [Planctomycetota bacterium]|nr:Hsp20/alpha crystallin family protein [Planctomycetota bacterium]MDA1248142.1 Hsp20/alpha crystallin family protein [Planctomycetota bacterium]
MAVFRLGQNWNHSFRDLEREVDQLLKGVQATFQGLRCGRQYPPVNVFELDDEFLLTAELPGVRVEDVDLTISAGVLTIRGLRIEDKAPADSSFRRQERAFGSWQRSLTLPDRVVEEGLAAELTNGILRIHLPKAPLEAARQIPVSEG